ncbi:hypothetical protein HYALB_00009727 [Hymenoscyphus albidus]|uniref:Uncharacterized protein n=1 Tax=Hymenoscyphus albidus TaxID=595503 RepID=A0A9N9LFG0_9HELO|nr:hypothetical protein HYALB_00009727 [Hymenoscyphus albidus]
MRTERSEWKNNIQIDSSGKRHQFHGSMPMEDYPGERLAGDRSVLIGDLDTPDENLSDKLELHNSSASTVLQTLPTPYAHSQKRHAQLNYLEQTLKTKKTRANKLEEEIPVPKR